MARQKLKLGKKTTRKATQEDLDRVERQAKITEKNTGRKSSKEDKRRIQKQRDIIQKRDKTPTTTEKAPTPTERPPIVLNEPEREVGRQEDGSILLNKPQEEKDFSF